MNSIGNWKLEYTHQTMDDEYGRIGIECTAKLNDKEPSRIALRGSYRIRSKYDVYAEFVEDPSEEEALLDILHYQLLTCCILSKHEVNDVTREQMEYLLENACKYARHREYYYHLRNVLNGGGLPGLYQFIREKNNSMFAPNNRHVMLTRVFTLGRHKRMIDVYLRHIISYLL